MNPNSKIFLLLGLLVPIFHCHSLVVDGEDKRLIKTSADKKAEWMTEPEIWELIQNRTTFVDVTDLDLATVESNPTHHKTDKEHSRIPLESRFIPQVKGILGNLNSTRVSQFFNSFTSYHDRYYKSQSGTASTNWLLSQIEESISKSEAKYSDSGVKVVAQQFNHSWSQRSLIARIPGQDPILGKQVVIVGAHLDSINMVNRYFKAPGADDNGSGSAVVMETLRCLLESGFVSKRTLEFHWYAAEEVGLKGSGQVAKAYKETGVDVVSMVNFDVVGHQENGTEAVGIYTDNSDKEVSQFLRVVAKTYLKYGTSDETCGYGCSDHASWTIAGFPSAMAAEVKLNRKMHTSFDSVKSLSIPQVMEFAKLSLGYMVEMGEPFRK